jgi:hypothetical protein
MGDILTKAKEFLFNGAKSVGSVNLGKYFRGASRIFIIGFAILVYLPIIFYLAGWLYIAVTTKSPNLDALIVLINTIFSNSVMYGMGVIGLALVDKDHDGNPDIYENELKSNTPE